MGYGLGAFLLAAGLVLALAVQDTISGVDLTLVGWILVLVGILALVLTAVTANRGRGIRTTETTQHGDGSHTVERASYRDLTFKNERGRAPRGAASLRVMSREPPRNGSSGSWRRGVARCDRGSVLVRVVWLGCSVIAAMTVAIGFELHAEGSPRLVSHALVVGGVLLPVAVSAVIQRLVPVPSQEV